MFRYSWLTGLMRRLSCSANVPRTRRPSRPSAVYSVERLEPRELLSASPAGPETQVNTTTTGAQKQSAMAMDASGDYVVVWTSDAQDGSGLGIYAQRYNAAGVKQAGEFRVNTTTADNQSRPAVAMDSAGDFVVTWESGNEFIIASYDIYAQRYNAAGVKQGGEFLVNTTTAGWQQYSKVAMDATGDFVIAWSGGANAYAQRYNAAGVRQGGEIFTPDSYADSVAMNATGDFVMTYTHVNASHDYEVHAQRFNATGVAQGAEVRVNTFASGGQYTSSVAMDAAGDFVVTWDSVDQDGSQKGVYAQRYNAAGVKQGSEFRVNTTTLGPQNYSTVAMDPTGDFVITWNGILQGPYGGYNGYGVTAQRYNAAGVRQGAEFQVNTTHF